MYQVLGYAMYKNKINDGGKGIVRIYLAKENKFNVKVIDVGYKGDELFFRNKTVKSDMLKHMSYTDKKKQFLELPKNVTWEWCIDNFTSLKKLKRKVELYKTKIKITEPSFVLWFEGKPFIIAKDSSMLKNDIVNSYIESE